jgi:hypothetical protein
MPEVVADDREIGTGLEERDGTAMAQDMWRHFPFPKLGKVIERL